jgi:hypothetical protein
VKRHVLVALLVCGAAAQGQNYPYSIHPFGIHSLDEFNEIKAEYPDLYSLDGAVHMAQLRRDKHWYVSYLNKSIYWTRTPLLIHAREMVWTDGQHYIRGRCGNQLSPEPMGPVEPHPPLGVASDEPLPSLDSRILPWMPIGAFSGAAVSTGAHEAGMPVENRSVLGPFRGPVLGEDVSPLLPPLAFQPISVFAGRRRPAGAALVVPIGAAAIPEPCTLLLLILGLLLLLCVRQWKQCRGEKQRQ